MAKKTSKKKNPAAKKPTAGKKSKTTKATRKPAQQRASTGKNAKLSRPAAQPPKKSTAKPQPSKANTPTGKTKSRSEFRIPKKKPNDRRETHPMYIYKEQGNIAVGLGITHDAENSNRSKTRELKKNPNPNDPRPAKIMKKAERIAKEHLGPRLKSWGFQTKKDRETVNELIKENNKKGN